MKTNCLIIIEIWEGLGNQLFQYSYGRFLKERGLNVQLDLRKTYDCFFPAYENHAYRENSIQNFNITLPEIDVEKYGKYNYIKRDNTMNKIIFGLAEHGLWKYKFYEEPMSRHINMFPHFRGNYYIKAWFQNEKYLRQIRGILLRELTPKKKIRISGSLHKALEKDITVSLHVRRGDFVNTKKMLPVSYFRKAIDFMKKKYENPLFLVFSEDLDWAKNNLHICNNCIYVNEDRKLRDYEELIIMSRCKSNIISNSTFSWWGAWLNQNPKKIVIAPGGKWSPKQSNIIPEGWVVI